MATAIFVPRFIMAFPVGLSHILRAVLAKDSSSESPAFNAGPGFTSERLLVRTEGSVASPFPLEAMVGAGLAALTTVASDFNVERNEAMRDSSMATAIRTDTIAKPMAYGVFIRRQPGFICFFVDMVMLATGETGFKRSPRLRPVHRLLFGMASAPFHEANGGKCYRKFFP